MAWWTPSRRSNPRTPGRSVSDMSQEGPSSTSLLETFCDGDLQQAELILNSSLESASVGTRDQLSLVRPVILQLENDWRAGQRSYTDTVYAFWNVEQLLSRLESQRPSQTRPKGSAWVGSFWLPRQKLSTSSGCQSSATAFVRLDGTRRHSRTIILTA